MSRHSPSLALGQERTTATAAAGAATCHGIFGQITSESLTTAAAAAYTLTLTNREIAANDMVIATVQMGTATTGEPVLSTSKAAAGSVVFIIHNRAAAAALNGTIVVKFHVVKAV